MRWIHYDDSTRASTCGDPVHLLKYWRQGCLNRWFRSKDSPQINDNYRRTYATTIRPRITLDRQYGFQELRRNCGGRERGAEIDYPCYNGEERE